MTNSIKSSRQSFPPFRRFPSSNLVIPSVCTPRSHDTSCLLSKPGFPVLPGDDQVSRLLNGEALDLVAHGADLTGQLTGLVAGDASGDDGAADTTGASKVHLAADVDVGNVLVLAKEGDVQQNSQRVGIGGEDDELGDTTVEGLGRFVGSLLELAGVGSGLDEIQELLLELGISQGPGYEMISACIYDGGSKETYQQSRTCCRWCGC